VVTAENGAVLRGTTLAVAIGGSNRARDRRVSGHQRPTATPRARVGDSVTVAAHDVILAANSDAHHDHRRRGRRR
jgi:hypothetical protein